MMRVYWWKETTEINLLSKLPDKETSKKLLLKMMLHARGKIPALVPIGQGNTKNSYEMPRLI